MGLSFKNIYYISFVLTVIYSIFGIFKMGEVGGPCNGGIAIIELIPILFIASIFQLSSFNLWSKSTKRNWFYPILSFIGISIWCWASTMFLDENAIGNLLYLSPFFILSIATIIIIILKTPQLIQTDLS